MASVESSRTLEARIIHTLLTKKAMHDSDKATPAATVVTGEFRVDRASQSLIVPPKSPLSPLGESRSPLLPFEGSKSPLSI